MQVHVPDPTAWSIGFYLNVLAMCLVMLRLSRRERQMSTSLGNPSFYKYPSDIFIVVAYRLEIRRGSEGNERSSADLERLLLSKYISDLLYTLANGATKISFASFFIEQHHMLHPGRPDFVKARRWATYWTITFTWLHAMQCHPLQKAWKADVEGTCINSIYVRIFQMSTSLSVDLLMLFTSAAFMLLTRINRLELTLIVFVGLIIGAIDIYSNFMAASWTDGLVQGTSYQGLIWPVIDLFIRVVYANTPFLYTVYTGHPTMKNPV
ncbi:hypothetical protein N0V84_004246 [Fusarium piperis]|uniref:Rhodopsin domain-containing protein n=1 Tax=Fusarium piperis TaxID=1435070 RepID=A0A9W8WFZ0_9HYPO|nr:hypothetical protein N0V84_004246 [Fusarium piperis]